MVEAFEGNKAETTTMLPVITSFIAAHQLCDVTVVADAGMISEANQHAIEDAGLSFILEHRIPDEPYAVTQWRREHPGQDIPDGQIFTQPWPAAGAQKARGRRDKVIYYQYRADRGRRTLRGIDEQVAKAEKAVAGQVPVKRNRFITLADGKNSVNRELEAKARGLAGLKGYTTNLAACPDGTPVTAEFVIGSYHQLWRSAAAGLPPQARVHRRPPDHRVRRPRGHQVHRGPHRLVHQALRAHRPPLPNNRDPRRPAHPHCRGPPTARPARGPRAASNDQAVRTDTITGSPVGARQRTLACAVARAGQ